jgi:toxin ParE2
MIVRFVEAAQKELEEATAYYDEKRAGLGDEFAAEVEAAVERIRNFPNAWTRLSPNVGRCRTNRFPYGLVFQARPNEILILAVMHLHRKPGYWKERLDR